MDKALENAYGPGPGGVMALAAFIHLSTRTELRMLSNQECRELGETIARQLTAEGWVVVRSEEWTWAKGAAEGNEEL
jgi:hypothetical protein